MNCLMMISARIKRMDILTLYACLTPPLSAMFSPSVLIPLSCKRKREYRLWKEELIQIWMPNGVPNSLLHVENSLKIWRCRKLWQKGSLRSLLFPYLKIHADTLVFPNLLSPHTGGFLGPHISLTRFLMLSHVFIHSSYFLCVFNAHLLTTVPIRGSWQNLSTWSTKQVKS